MKLILGVLLAAVSSMASAAWTTVHTDNECSYNIDIATTSEEFNKVKMWNMVDCKRTRKGNPNFLSVKSQVEYDCKEEKTRTLAYVEYSENMGAGKEVHSHSKPFDWQPLVPGSVAEMEWNIACGKI